MVFPLRRNALDHVQAHTGGRPTSLPAQDWSRKSDRLRRNYNQAQPRNSKVIKGFEHLLVNWI